MRVLVTGGAGFIGSHIVDALLAAGHEVAVLDDLSSGRRENVASSATLHTIDIRNRDAVFELLRSFRPQAVTHQAAQASVVVSMREPARDLEVNVVGSAHLLEACAEVDVEQFVFASTGGAIYGEVPDPERAKEDWAPHPISPYAISKYTVEQIMRVFRKKHGIQTTTLRYANVYGPRQDPHGEAGVVSIFARAALANERLRVFARRSPGDGGCVRDYVYVADVVRANLAAIEGRLASSCVNVATGTPTTTKELALGISRLVRGDVAIEDGPPREGDVERSVLDPSQFRELLGPTTLLDQGLAETVAWFRAKHQ